MGEEKESPAAEIHSQPAPLSMREDEEGGQSSGSRKEISHLFSEFMVRVVKLEEMATASSRFLTAFQQGLDFLRRPPIDKGSTLVKSIIESNETRRMKSYVEMGCVSSHDRVQAMSNVTSCIRGLQDHINVVKSTLEELKCLMEDTGRALQAAPAPAPESTSGKTELDLGIGFLQEEPASHPEENASRSFDYVNYASLMAIMYGMVNQDYVMQERVTSSLNLKILSGELDTYCIMWSLRPFVNDDIIYQAVRRVS